MFEAAVRAAPDFAEAHANLGLMYLKSGRLDVAGREFDEALRLAPNLPAARNGLQKLNEARSMESAAPGRS